MGLFIPAGKSAGADLSAVHVCVVYDMPGAAGYLADDIEISAGACLRWKSVTFRRLFVTLAQ